ncbi:PLDc N-terminal domain-containing protein [Breznakia pachnodae]|uniref:Membrane protein YjdF n=1 Tax=Breznakia pachnodae TaxID=265178 RepID=A0ABU0DZU8_9FIRM|nr:PLDc N-terminal domain-containing protein [Breznakia pachnodae]MDQ0360164.1 putative membrane protein YjdF [Breznakia pachnodae]
MTLHDILPFLIPLIIVEAILLIITLRHILTHNHYKRGNRVLWIIISIVGVQFIGPILYFVFGRED